MSNPRISAKERGLIKGAVRRVFSRSDLRRQVVARSQISHSDPAHPRVTKWSRCEECLKPTPSYKIEVDHKTPIIPVEKSLEEITWDELINRVWTSDNDLAALCKPCHAIKTKAENKERARLKKLKKELLNGPSLKPQRTKKAIARYRKRRAA